ncbi:MULTISPECIES: quaternary ammonium compound efflux SMR transporter SugE [Thiomicrorhabdus]|uniref:Guanidinium exporter n=1 Tax=Thiomicrorhabdus heinhorstiae TaxID=2748010 RepID=A0ABS0BXF3_9GAMM|nr:MULTISPECIES: quaternary ammonium compound efflux SMR transporter SugE [Thiomicrorhabdus]MBF6056747.1 quaternary ammonium compound efflux SMR transporter SugE [Thiomicrorhabdus heinhorstiae]
MAWVALVLAGLLEVGWAIGLKYADGFSKFWPSALSIVAMLVSLVLLGWVMKYLPVGLAYAVWVGIGVVGTVILSVILFSEPMNAIRMLSIALIVIGIIGLKLTSPG